MGNPDLGWKGFFAAQLGESDAGWLPARVIGTYRGRVDVLGDGLEASIAVTGKAREFGIAVGDWLLVDPAGPAIRRRLDRFGLFQRRAAGTSGEVQRIAANVDTLFIVTSANRDFNVARLERYLAIAHDAAAYPLIVITKADTVDSTRDLVAAASRLSPGLLVEALDARDPGQLQGLRAWCGAGQTVALVGSSGVGKSTLINTLAGTRQETCPVREDDQRGRHTTTNRSMHSLPDGGWVIDTPGMRELQLVDVAESLDELFGEIVALAADCRLANCAHESEPGCAVRAAIDAGELDEDRLRRYRKLLSEERRNSESLAERRSRERQTGKFYKSVIAGKRAEKSDS